MHNFFTASRRDVPQVLIRKNLNVPSVPEFLLSQRTRQGRAASGTEYELKGRASPQRGTAKRYSGHSVDTVAYSNLLRRLDGFDPWLSSLGLTPRLDDRLHQAFKILKIAEGASRKGRETGVYSDIQPGHWFPLIETLEAHDVLCAFESDGSPFLSSAVKRALSGPAQAINEGPKNRDGRNVWFELALAAEWRLRGAAVTIQEPDLRLVRDDTTFFVACKRPDKQESIHANIRDAVEQLTENLGRAPEGVYGVAAISLTRVFNRGDKVFSGDLHALEALIEKELENHYRYLRSIDDPRICGIIFHVATPSNFERGVDLSRTSYGVAQELKPSAGSRVLKEHVQDMRDAAKSCGPAL